MTQIIQLHASKHAISFIIFRCVLLNPCFLDVKKVVPFWWCLGFEPRTLHILCIVLIN